MKKKILIIVSVIIILGAIITEGVYIWRINKSLGLIVEKINVHASYLQLHEVEWQVLLSSQPAQFQEQFKNAVTQGLSAQK